MIPGFSATRVEYPPNTTVPRRDGATFNDQWQAALDTGVKPAMVTLTSFNEWHEGSQIEPVEAGRQSGQGYAYHDFGAMGADGYLALTRKWVEVFQSRSWPEAYRVRITILTTSDWTTIGLVSGGTWLRFERVSASESAIDTVVDELGDLVLTQSFANANAGQTVEMVWDLVITDLDPTGNVAFEIDRGNLGATRLTISNYLGTTPVELKTFIWGGITSGRNSRRVELPAQSLMSGAP